jgi:hypothetical protein
LRRNSPRRTTNKSSPRQSVKQLNSYFPTTAILILGFFAQFDKDVHRNPKADN